MALSLLDLIRITSKDLRGNWVRSGLTTLSIFMGVAVVNTTLNISTITNRQIQQKLSERDNPYLVPMIFPEGGYSSMAEIPKLGTEEITLLQREVPGIGSISSVTSIYRLSTVQFQGRMANDVDVLAVSESYQRTTGRQILEGRFFEQADFDEYRPVAIIDSVLAELLFPEESPLWQGIYAGGTRFTVVGISETKKQYAEQEPSGQLWITQNYGNALEGTYTFNTIQVALRQLNTYEDVQDQVKQILLQRYPNFEVYVWGNAEDLYKEEQQQRTSSMILQIVGLFALVIGGIGIANITVASVVERTREIGLRRAVGATDLEVILQFVAEVVLLSLAGGVAAVITVHFLTGVATTTLFVVPYEFSLLNGAISIATAFTVGVGSSFFPALRVTQIDIVQALRGE